MCATSCTIEFENNTECYRPGEVIKGLVILNINGSSTILIKALSLQFSGFAYTKWEKPQKVNKSGKPKPTIYIENREDYVSTTNYLIGSEMANPKHLEPGKYSYNFMVNIPQNVPSTFDSPLGYIRYELIVNADYGGHIVSLYNSAIHIEQWKDLRLLDPSVQLPEEKEQLEHKSCLKFWQKPLQLYVSVPQKAFIAGECISVHIKLTNLAKLKLDTITSNLNRIAAYKGFIKDKTPQTTNEITTIASNIHRLFGQNSNVIQHLQQIFIPKVPPTMAFDECKCIGVSYELEVLVTCQNKRRWVRASIPILMGTISLKSDLKIIPMNFANNNVASITVGRSMDELTLPSSMDLQPNMVEMQTTQLSASMGSLGSSFQEAEFMTGVQLNKKSRHQIAGDLSDFKPKYLYYDLPEQLQQNLQDDVATTSQPTTSQHNEYTEKIEML
ncbi:arrestin domain-containing protein 17 [Calliphora vicina]|uniref:arrestin domain-containing protein 17 n=1 Tax=Calliphora vicina TaxID=7373 RepID=UPI00325AD627